VAKRVNKKAEPLEVATPKKVVALEALFISYLSWYGQTIVVKPGMVLTSRRYGQRFIDIWLKDLPDGFRPIEE
jgi:hypothetical protein